MSAVVTITNREDKVREGFKDFIENYNQPAEGYLKWSDEDIQQAFSAGRVFGVKEERERHAS